MHKFLPSQTLSLIESPCWWLLLKPSHGKRYTQAPRTLPFQPRSSCPCGGGGTLWGGHQTQHLLMPGSKFHAQLGCWGTAYTPQTHSLKVHNTPSPESLATSAGWLQAFILPEKCPSLFQGEGKKWCPHSMQTWVFASSFSRPSLVMFAHKCTPKHGCDFIVLHFLAPGRLTVCWESSWKKRYQLLCLRDLYVRLRSSWGRSGHHYSTNKWSVIIKIKE